MKSRAVPRSIVSKALALTKKFRDQIAMRWFPVSYAKIYYRARTGKRLNYRNVQNLNEKLFWLERHWRDPLISTCTDKYAVRQYVEDCGFGSLLNELYGVYDDASEVDVCALPNKFVLKCTHGCKYNIFCVEKHHFDMEAARERLNTWMGRTYGLGSAEWHYSGIKPRIIAERYIEPYDGRLMQFQLYCFNGKPTFFLARNDLTGGLGHAIRLSYDLDWKRLFYRKGEEAVADGYEQPHNLRRMIECARELGRPFPHVRVDFFEVGQALTLGELTFSTSANVLSTLQDDVLERLGRELRLPRRSWNGGGGANARR